jgi:hypothetical protein
MASTLQNLLKNKAEKDAKQPDKKVLPSSTNQLQPVPTTTNHSQVVPTPTKQKIPISPTKNFTKVPNSVTSEAIPQGLFKGLSKHTYDVLYKLTRGAINPIREIQLTRLELMKLTGLSENTQRAHVKYLSIAGLLKITYQTGKHEGATYEVLVPEELQGITPTNPYQVVPTTTDQYQPEASSSKEYQKLVPVTSQNLVGVTTTNPIENKDPYGDSNTLIKTNTTDDEENHAFSLFIGTIVAASKKLTGKGISRRDREKWQTLAELLVLELEVAARRTDNISSVPAFLTEVLRRKLRDAPTTSKPSKVKIDTVGKPESDSYEIKPLDRKSREAALEQLREFAEDEFLQDFKKWYTKEDWNWLMKKLGIN